MNLFLGRPYTGSVVDGNTDRIRNLNPGAGTFGIDNEVYLAGSVPVIVGFSRTFPVPTGTTSVQVGADFSVSGEVTAAGMHWGYASASLLVNIKAVGLGLLAIPNGDNHTFRQTRLIQISGAYYQTPSVGRFFGSFWMNDMEAFRPAAGTRSYLLSATIESWAGCGGLASWAVANVFSATLIGFFITCIP